MAFLKSHRWTEKLTVRRVGTIILWIPRTDAFVNHYKDWSIQLASLPARLPFSSRVVSVLELLSISEMGTISSSTAVFRMTLRQSYSRSFQKMPLRSLKTSKWTAFKNFDVAKIYRTKNKIKSTNAKSQSQVLLLCCYLDSLITK